jgi:hypothetical protein
MKEKTTLAARGRNRWLEGTDEYLRALHSGHAKYLVWEQEAEYQLPLEGLECDPHGKPHNSAGGHQHPHADVLQRQSECREKREGSTALECFARATESSRLATAGTCWAAFITPRARSGVGCQFRLYLVGLLSPKSLVSGIRSCRETGNQSTAPPVPGVPELMPVH